MVVLEQNKTEIIAMIGLQDIAEHFDVTPRGIQKWVAGGQFPKPIRVGRRLLRWPIEEINTWILAGCPHFEKEEAL